ncbi:MAG: hypothetical protein AAFO79_07615 [Pseudomonadota bacterium]
MFAFQPDQPTFVATGRRFERVPERLVVEGYRHCNDRLQFGHVDTNDPSSQVFEAAVGRTGQRHLLDAMATYIDALDVCDDCPLLGLTRGRVELCLNEWLTVALIAGVQHSDDQTLRLCLQHLTCAQRREQLACAAGAFGFAMKAYQQVLLPLPAPVVERALSAELPRTVGSTSAKAVH